MLNRLQDNSQRPDTGAPDGDELLQALRESEAWFRAISDASPLGIFVTNPQGDCLYTNKVYQAISGLSLDEALGQGWSRAIHPDDRERVFSTWYAFAEDQTEFDSEHRFMHRDGKAVLTHVRAALAEVERSRFDIVVSDIGMPEMDGYALIRRVRGLGSQRGGSVPAVALTAYAWSEDRLRALRAGYQTHVAKPIEPFELVAVIASLAGHAKTGDDKQP